VAKKDKGKNKGKGKTKIPKTVAGVKVPKSLRQGLAGSLLDNPRARELLADVLLAAAGAAAAALVKNPPSGRQVAEAGEAVVDAGADAATATRDVVQGGAGAVTEAVAGAARRLLPDSLTGDDDQGEGGTERYAHLADKDRKGKKDKQRAKASKH
jgi:hypothetical protein